MNDMFAKVIPLNSIRIYGKKNLVKFLILEVLLSFSILQFLSILSVPSSFLLQQTHRSLTAVGGRTGQLGITQAVLPGRYHQIGITPAAVPRPLHCHHYAFIRRSAAAQLVPSAAVDPLLRILCRRRPLSRSYSSFFHPPSFIPRRPEVHSRAGSRRNRCTRRSVALF